MWFEGVSAPFFSTYFHNYDKEFFMIGKKLTAAFLGAAVIGGGSYSAYQTVTAADAPAGVSAVTLKLGSLPADSTLLPGVTLKLG